MNFEKEIQVQENFISNNMLEKVGNLYLTKYQQKDLQEHHIPYMDCQDMKSLLFLLSDISDDEEYDELEDVAREISEFSYYHETHK